MKLAGRISAMAGLLATVACATDEESAGLRPPYYKKWRGNPKMVVFGDSTSDAGRRFDAPASFSFEGIGKFPWTKLFDAPDSESKFRAYLPAPGSPTNGKVWASWLRIPEELNFATSSGSASEAFRSLESCTGYTGEGEEFPTATLEEQITRYFHDIDGSSETLDYTHVIALGGNDPGRAASAAQRYAIGGPGYVDPVAFENVFEIVDGVPQFTPEPTVRIVLAAWQEGIARLIDAGVTGKILLANLPSVRGVPAAIASGQADLLDQVALAVRDAAQLLFADVPNVEILDLYTLSAAIVDKPEIFEDLGFTVGTGETLGFPCLQYNFVVDDTPEIMGTQGLRAADCPEECALCTDLSSPCESCLQGNPSATVCDGPDSYLFWDVLHFTTAFHQILAEAIRQCSKDEPDYETPWVTQLCP